MRRVLLGTTEARASVAIDPHPISRRLRGESRVGHEEVVAGDAARGGGGPQPAFVCGVDQGASGSCWLAPSRSGGAAERSFVAVWLVLAWAVWVFQYMAKSNRNAHGPVLVAATVLYTAHPWRAGGAKS